HDGLGAAIAHGEPLARDTADKRATLRGAVQHYVADEDVLLRDEGAVLRRADDQLASGQALPEVVVRIPLHHEGNAVRQEGAEALAGRPGELHLDRVFRQALLAV